MKKILLRILFLLLLFSTFFIIFKFSSQIVEESDGISKEILSKFINAFPYTKNLSEETKIKLIEHGNPIIRKLAHFSIYGLVGIWIMAFMSTFDIRLYKQFLTSLWVGILYAISDEYHQNFVAGRGPSIMDVCIDTMGVACGIIFVLIVISIYIALKSDKKDKKEKK